MSLSAATLAVAVACSDEDPTGPPPACVAAVQLAISPGTSPDLTWMPVCGVARLVIVKPPSAGFVDAWTIRAPDAGIGPPVRYGVVPSRAAQDRAAEPLTPGQTYRAYLFDAAGTELASVPFVP